MKFSPTSTALPYDFFRSYNWEEVKREVKVEE